MGIGGIWQWLVLLLPTVLIASPFFFFYFKKKKSDLSSSVKGIYGWLLIFAIYQLYHTGKKCVESLIHFADTIQHKVFLSGFPAIVYGEVILELLGVFLFSYTFYLLVTKHHKFKLFYLYQLIYVILNVPADTLLIIITMGMPLNSASIAAVLEKSNQQIWFGHIISSIFWLLYIISSKRVRATFGYPTWNSIKPVIN